MEDSVTADPLNADEKWRLQMKDIFKTIRSLAIDNMEYFQTGKHSYHSRFHTAFCLLHEHIEKCIEPLTDDIIGRVALYDLSPSVHGNGYRSLIKVIEKCCLYILQLGRHISVTRSSLFFRSSFYCKEIEAYVATLGQLKACLYYAQRLISFCSEGNLFAEEGNLSGPLAEQLLMEVELMKQNSFYGRCLGFQFVESMHRPLQAVSVAMASFSEAYHETSGVLQFATALLNSGKYIVNPELRASQIVKITQTADIDFCKAFWSITESDLLYQLPAIMCPTVQVDELISLEPETFDLFVGDMKSPVTIRPALANTGPSPFNVRLISYDLREGQDPKSLRRLTRRKIQPLSNSLVIHCHGGGFVAQSSKSHEVYLKHWAKDLGVPILSIDYSLAPEQPFPRALEECYYAYAWALNNLHRLGTTGERICFAGDSAGANLLVSTTLRAISNGVHLPNGLMCAYTPTLVRYTPSPSRLLTMMDPLLPVGILSRCLAAYAGVSDSLTTKHTPEDHIHKDVKPLKNLCYDHVSLDTGFGSTDSIVSRERSIDNEYVLLDDPYGLKRMDKSIEGASKQEINSGMCITQTGTIHNDSECITDNNNTPDILLRKECEDMKSFDKDIDPTLEISRETGDIIISHNSLCGVEADDKNHDAVSSQSANADCDRTLSVDNLGKKEDHRNITPSVSSSLSNESGEKESEAPKSGCRQREVILNEFDATSLTKDNPKSPTSIPRVKSTPSLSRPMSRLGTMTDTVESPIFEENRLITSSPRQLFRNLSVVEDPYMSPLLAPDELLKLMPPTYLVACHLDPILDDSVMFAKKLRQLGSKVYLHLIDGLPHGFLNFTLVSKDAKAAGDICVAYIDNILNPA